MPSPFPGMDPYLEDPTGWGGVHTGLIVAIQAELNRVLPEGFVARIHEYVWVRDEDDDDTLRKPDAFIPDTPSGPRKATAVVGVATAPTVRTRLPRSEKKKNRFVQIVTTRNREVLTVLELLSPKNKGSGEGQDVYAQKRREYLASVNFLEIDLLRAGNRFPMGRPAPPPADYAIVSCRKSEYPAIEVGAFTIRDPLPVIPVPVSPRHPDVILNLRAAWDRVYAEGRYADTIDYTVPPRPPLLGSDAAWAAELLKKPAKKSKR